MCQSFRRGYNAALRALRRRVAATIEGAGLTADQTAILSRVTATCRALRLPVRAKPRLATFAARYDVCLRTIKNWKRAGCPFAQGHRAVIAWMFRRRRTLPPGPREKFAREFQEMAVTEAMDAVKRVKAEIGERRDLPALAMLAARMRTVFEALEPMEGPSLWRKAQELHSLAKTAVRFGLWE